MRKLRRNGQCKWDAGRMGNWIERFCRALRLCYTLALRVVVAKFAPGHIGLGASGRRFEEIILLVSETCELFCRVAAARRAVFLLERYKYIFRKIEF